MVNQAQPSTVARSCSVAVLFFLAIYYSLAMNKNILIVGAALALAVVFALPVAALVAGLMAWLTPLSFWTAFLYATIGCAAFNCSATWRKLHKLAN